ncbi:LysR family transcriptional regulator [Gloeocapsa sp. PCC 73106]|uniref:LysR family transcriptional regulator n=1 Tax=Gloeocapsa sp. PCC 73106 TaxID=102232 RepID=UPI0002ACADF8|nr:LysR family transcriptional regulator [Gloeocapsa sp. PCC 73106]ELR99163.1 transcriptional regulator [Gloeocapsa sp. PCC 73106]
MKLQEIDLNLLFILKVLLEEKGVTKASEKLNLTQSATSHALNRLRKMFNDPLLMRSPYGMLPTPRAITLQKSLENILVDIEQLIEEPIFRPETAKGTIRIAASDYANTVILPSVVKELFQKSPHVDIQCYEWRADTLEKIANKEIDIGLGVLDIDQPNSFLCQNLFKERFVSIVRADHPILQEVITMESYIAWPHALVTIGSSINSIKKSPKSHVDQVLEKLGLKRRLMLKLPHFLAAALIVSQTDLIVTLPRRITLLFTNIAEIAFFEPPIDLGEYNYMLIWAKHSDHIPLQMWLRNIYVNLTISFPLSKNLVVVTLAMGWKTNTMMQ